MLTVLNHSHLDLFLDLKKNNPGQWRMGEEFDKLYDPKDFYFNMLMNKQSYTIGWIEDNSLSSIASLYEDPASPAWCFLYFTNRKTTFWDYNKVKGDILFSELFQEGFRRKLTSCIILTRRDFKPIHSQTSDRMKKRLEKTVHVQTPEIQLFHWVDEAIIPANTSPKYPFMQQLLLNRTWPFDFVLRRGILKQEFRQESAINYSL
jgi:hypothetical protein